MSYIGNTNTTQGFTPAVDYFSGNGSTVAFTLSRPVASVAQVQANISNVPQNPSSAFSVSGNTITFTSAPPSGTNNIYVYYTSPISQVIAPGQGTVSPTSLSTGGPYWDTSGNVGIGTTSPSGKLHVAGTAATALTSFNSTGTTTSYNLTSITNTSGSAYYGVESSAGGSVFTGSTAYATVLGTGASTSLQFATNNSVRATIDSSGNVGVGTSSPSSFTAENESKLTVGTGSGNGGITVYTGSTSQGGIFFADGTSGAATYSGILRYNHSDNAMLFYTNGLNERMRIDSSGNVGIGTNSPGSYRLYVEHTGAQVGGFNSTAANGGYMTWGTSGTVIADLGTAVNCFGTGGTDTFAINGRGARALLLGTNNTERMRIDSSGQVFFSGLSSVPYLGFGNVGIISMRNGNTGSSNRAAAFGTNTTTLSNVVTIFNNNGEIGSISTSGSTTTFSTSSDYRLKENVQPMQGALAALNQLNPVTYTWKTDGSSGQGFIAHEIQAIVPECVIGEKDAVETYIDQDGNEQTRPVYQGIDTSFLVATLTAAIKEQQAIIQTLTDRITALENK